MKAKVYPLKKMNSELKMPASVFCLHIEIICASLAKGTSVIKNIVNSKDIDTTIEWCKNIGANIKKGSDRIIIKGVNNKLFFEHSLFNCNDSSTTAKLMIPVLCINSKPFGIKASEKIIEELKSYSYIYEAYGVSYFVEEGLIRFEKTMKATEFEVDGDIDNYLSAGILLALPLLKEPSIFKLRAPIRSEKNYNTLTKILKTFGVDIKHPSTMRYDIAAHQKYKARTIKTEKDNFYLSHIALLTQRFGSEDKLALIKYKNTGTLDDLRLFNFIKKNCVDYKNYLVSHYLKKKEFAFHKIEYQVENSLPLLMVLASLNNQDCVITKVDFNKERIVKQYSIMSEVFTKLGIQHSKFEKEVYISPCNLTIKKQVDCKEDPYVAMALTILALLSQIPIVIKNVDSLFDLYGDFFKDLKEIDAKIEFIHD